MIRKPMANWKEPTSRPIQQDIYQLTLPENTFGGVMNNHLLLSKTKQKHVMTIWKFCFDSPSLLNKSLPLLRHFWACLVVVWTYCLKMGIECKWGKTGLSLEAMYQLKKAFEGVTGLLLATWWNILQEASKLRPKNN